MASMRQSPAKSAWKVLTDLPRTPASAESEWAESIMQLPPGERHHEKQGRSIGRFVLPGPKHPVKVFLKRQHHSPRWLGWLARLFPRLSFSTSIREARNLETVRALGVPVPRVYAAAECMTNSGLRSFLAVEELQGMLALHEAVPMAARKLTPPDFRAWKRGVAAEIARLTKLLHDAGCFHQDLYLCHFFVAERDITEPPACWRNRLVLIDFHRLARSKFARAWNRIKDLAQLLYSSRIAGIELRDRLAFWRAYCSNISGPAQENDRSLSPASGERGRGEGVADFRPQWRNWKYRWLRRLVIWKARRYEHHNRKLSEARPA